MATTDDGVKNLRNAFLIEASNRGPDAFDPKDLERVKKSDHWVQRFLQHHDGNAGEALKMMVEALTWRKEFQANDVNNLVKQDILALGGFFAHGRDKDGCSIFVLKCKKYVKNAHPPEDLRRCVIYWFERLERQDKGKPITLFFDMKGCGLNNLDLEFTQYLIGLFKQYYPFYLNYILIFEMPWILNAAFKIIKTWLPEKAVEKIKFLSAKDIKEYVPLDQALVCWGGTNDYNFRFIPEAPAQEEVTVDEAVSSNISTRKVHFADGSAQMSESPEGSGDKEQDGTALSVQPSGLITFVKDGGELCSTLELHNTDAVTTISYKLKTTSPEKFRVRPSMGLLAPGARATVQVSLLPGFQLGGLSRDKFLVMSTVMDAAEANADLVQLWKDTTGRKIHQHRLKCTQQGDGQKTPTPSGGSLAAGDLGSGDAPLASNQRVMAVLTDLTECQTRLHGSLQRLQHYQFATLVLVLLLGVLLSYVVYLEKVRVGGGDYCTKP